ncbi:hypothetical protein C0J45_1260 [Silurus meridionalis]|nr:hypothetical protein C0J45_1260 [Silurus meridionalis]
MRTLEEIEQLEQSRYGRPSPRHGLKLLYWFAKNCLSFKQNNVMLSHCYPSKGHFGFHTFENKYERNGYKLLPDVALPYYEVGNLSKPTAQHLPSYVREDYTGLRDSSNKDRIIVSLNNKWLHSIYVTEHSDWSSFNKQATYCISKHLIRMIRDLTLEEFLLKTGYLKEHINTHGPTELRNQLPSVFAPLITSINIPLLHNVYVTEHSNLSSFNKQVTYCISKCLILTIRVQSGYLEVGWCAFHINHKRITEQFNSAFLGFKSTGKSRETIKILLPRDLDATRGFYYAPGLVNPLCSATGSGAFQPQHKTQGGGPRKTAAALMVRDAEKTVLSHPLILNTSHQVTAILHNLNTQHITAQHRSGYETTLLATENLTIKPSSQSHSAVVALRDLLDNIDLDGFDDAHDRLKHIKQETSCRPEILDTALEEEDCLYVDGLCSKPSDDVYLCGYAVVRLPDVIVEAKSLPYTSTLAAELVALTRSCQLSEGNPLPCLSRLLSGIPLPRLQQPLSGIHPAMPPSPPQGDGSPPGSLQGEGSPPGSPYGDGLPPGSPQGDGSPPGSPQGDGSPLGSPPGSPQGDGSPPGSTQGEVGPQAPRRVKSGLQAPRRPPLSWVGWRGLPQSAPASLVLMGFGASGVSERLYKEMLI